jgi:uncharacterized protein YkwD
VSAAWLALLCAPAAQVQETPEALEARARTLEQQGELAQARELWLAVSRARDPGPQRDACVDSARALGMRLDLRRELIAARAQNERVFAELGVERADEAGLLVHGERLAWKDAGFELLARAGAAARLSQGARAGLVFERLARGGAKEKEAALADLGRMLETKEIEAHDASAAVARARGEALPARGYVFRNGKWIDADVLASDAHASALEALGRALENAPAAEREARLAALDAGAQEGRARADLALEARWRNAAAEILKSPCYDGLAALAREHAELEARRKHALELIFDEQKYFYPYNPPECPPEKAKLYAGVQQEVDTRVAAVRESWKSSRRVRLPERVRAAAEELAWNARTQKARKLEFAWPAGLPEWVRWLDPAQEELELSSFACSADERKRLDQDVRAARFNAQALAAKESDKLAEMNNDERAQLEITNEYRRMLGRALLAWDRKLQLSAQKHGDYQSKTGDFGHFEPDPARHGPVERMRAEGYPGGGGENCHMGDSGPEGAHVGWTHSSGHHRQILSPSAHELGVAVSGSVWTQNFGDGSEWEASAGKR